MTTHDKAEQKKPWRRDYARELEAVTSTTPNDLAALRRFPRRPGSGWKAYEIAPVWEHSTGLRVHEGGLCRLPSGSMVDGERWPECVSLQRAILEQGGTRRRGLMVWALSLKEAAC